MARRGDERTMQFIHLYREYECLRKPTSSLFKNKIARNNAYTKIQEELHLSEKEIKNKIKSLRSTYHQERNKVENSKRSEAGSNDIYKPTLIWFKEMDFINESFEYRNSIQTAVWSGRTFIPTAAEFGVALTEWRDGEDTWFSTLPLDPFCTVFQAEVALQRAIRRVKNGKNGLINIFSNFRSSLEVLTGPKTYHSLAHESGRDISEIVAEGRAVRLFCVRAHAGIAGNERADDLARRVALTKKTAVDYDRFLLSHAKKVIRAASLEEWQQRYAERSTAQTLTSHGGFAQYLFRFKLRHSPHCACDPAKTQDVLHVLEDCNMFLRERAALEAEIDVQVSGRHFPEILGDASKS
ncbi:hypothetical protein EVAR_30725_1 [Eumeta japonica]|uniref:MADF domain-containing protein n=1 Tax=Eumeta variegata TaxID=151549 RepID=A0A4C1V5R6_EUMVA|nr:hypothetical protein EVAR_30725_1 [Eumeta japonica]